MLPGNVTHPFLSGVPHAAAAKSHQATALIERDDLVHAADAVLAAHLYCRDVGHQPALFLRAEMRQLKLLADRPFSSPRKSDLDHVIRRGPAAPPPRSPQTSHKPDAGPGSAYST
jgi:hypothetical protein